MDEAQFKTFMESMAAWKSKEITAKGERDLINDLVANTSKSDGDNVVEFRAWLRDMQSNAVFLENNEAIIRLAMRTILGSLQREVARYIVDYLELNPGNKPHDVPWPELKEHLTREFVPPSEIIFLQKSLQTLSQTSRETLRSFNRRFRDLLVEAYPVHEQTQDQVRSIVESYMEGLGNTGTADAIRQVYPQSIDEAMSLAVSFEEIVENNQNTEQD